MTSLVFSVDDDYVLFRCVYSHFQFVQCLELIYLLIVRLEICFKSQDVFQFHDCSQVIDLPEWGSDIRTHTF